MLTEDGTMKAVEKYISRDKDTPKCVWAVKYTRAVFEIKILSVGCVTPIFKTSVGFRSSYHILQIRAAISENAVHCFFQCCQMILEPLSINFELLAKRTFIQSIEEDAYEFQT
jgi:hypothetical protein